MHRRCPLHSGAANRTGEVQAEHSREGNLVRHQPETRCAATLHPAEQGDRIWNGYSVPPGRLPTTGPRTRRGRRRRAETTAAPEICLCNLCGGIRAHRTVTHGRLGCLGAVTHSGSKAQGQLTSCHGQSSCIRGIFLWSHWGSLTRWSRASPCHSHPRYPIYSAAISLSLKNSLRARWCPSKA